MPTELHNWAKAVENKLSDLALADLKATVTTPEQLEAPTKQHLTFGEKLVGLTFNPSGDDKVGKAKRLCADLADLLHDEMYTGKGEVTELQSRLYSHAIGEILNAQMNVVKVLTLKY